LEPDTLCRGKIEAQHLLKSPPRGHPMPFRKSTGRVATKTCKTPRLHGTQDLGQQLTVDSDGSNHSATPAGPITGAYARFCR
jgi:hypothetical protein